MPVMRALVPSQAGTVLELRRGMMTRPLTQTPTPTPTQTRTVVRWTFEFGNNLVACAVSWQPATSTYVVSVIPNGCEDRPMTETFASGVAALERHAVLAAAFRARGWKTLAYSGAGTGNGRGQHRAA